MRTSDEIAQEVWRRVEISERRQEASRRKTRAVSLAAACFGIVAALSLALSLSAQDTLVANTSLYNAVMFSDGAAGGYVLTAVASFALGMAVTLFCVRKAGKK